eukprot:10877879-Ditylum_brightwellii.AAC.1
MEHDATKSQLQEHILANDTLRAQVDTVRSDLTESQNYVSVLEGERSALLQNVEDRRMEVAELRSAAEEAAAVAAKETERLGAETASLTYELNLKSMECDDVTSALAQANQKLVDVERTCREKAESNAREVEQLQLELREMSDSSGTLLLQVEQYMTDFNNLKMESESLKSDYVGAKDDIARLTEERMSLVEKVEEQRSQIAGLESVAKDAASAATTALSRKEEGDKTIKALRDEIEALKQSKEE